MAAVPYADSIALLAQLHLSDLWHLVYGFFIANALGYGGGPASIPLMYNEIVTRYGWLDHSQFANMLALGNALPGPIATKIAAYVGYDVAGWLGMVLALLATVLPSALALIFLIRMMKRYRHTHAVRGMTMLVQPVIAMMMLGLTFTSSLESMGHIGPWHFIGIAAVAFIGMNRLKIHPVFLILAAFVYGGIFLAQGY